jgi:hypothetical protein
MTEIYFINDYYVKATSWHNAAKSWLKYTGDASDVKFKAIDAMKDVTDIFLLLEAFASDIIERAGITKDYYYFDSYYEPEEDDFELA